MKFKKAAIAAVVLLLVVFTTGCQTTTIGTNQNDFKASDTTVDSAESTYLVETLKQAATQDCGYPTPFMRTSRGTGAHKVQLVFDSLLESDENGVIPWLAEKYEINGNDYTFYLHKDAKWHDNQKVTASDVAFTVEYYKEHIPVGDTLHNGDKFIVDEIKVIDDYTITLTVYNQNAKTLDNLGSFPIIPKHVWEKVSDPITYSEADAFVGCGMYKFTSYDPTSFAYEFTAFPDYYGGKQVAEKAQFVPVSDEILAFENREIDITSLTPDLIDKYEQDPTIGIMKKDNDYGIKILINFEKMPEFKDLEARKALCQAIDRQAIVDKVFRGYGKVGSAGYVPLTNPYYNSQIVQYEFDRTAAAKFFEGKNISVTLNVGNSWPSDSQHDLKIAELIKTDLSQVGIEVNVKSLDIKTNDQAVKDGDYEMALVGNGGWANTPDYMRTVLSSTDKNKGNGIGYYGPIGWDSEKISELADAQLAETNTEKRKEIFFELQKEVADELPVIVIGNRSELVMYRKDYFDGWRKAYNYQQFQQNRISYLQKAV